MAAVVHRAGEGEALFGGRIVIKAAFEELSITESSFAAARPGRECTCIATTSTRSTSWRASSA